MHRTRIDRNGRVLVPASIRRSLGLRENSELLVTVDDEGRMVMVTPGTAWARVQALLDDVDPKHSVVDELLAERRAEAASEADDERG